MATIEGHVVEDPIAAEKAVDAPVVTEGLAPVVAPGPNVFEQKAGDFPASASLAAENPANRPADSKAAASDAHVLGAAPPLPLEPEDLITSEDESVLEATLGAIKEVVVESIIDSHVSSSVDNNEAERVQHDLFADATTQ